MIEDKYDIQNNCTPFVVSALIILFRAGGLGILLTDKKPLESSAGMYVAYTMATHHVQSAHRVQVKWESPNRPKPSKYC